MRNVILIGLPNEGKSYIANLITGSNFFLENHVSDEKREYLKTHILNLEGEEYRIIEFNYKNDCFNSIRKNEITKLILNEFRSLFIRYSSEKINRILFITSFGRVNIFTQLFREIPSTLDPSIGGPHQYSL